MSHQADAKRAEPNRPLSRRAETGLLSLVLPSLSSACSTVNTTQYLNPAAGPLRPDTVAILPPLVESVSHPKVVTRPLLGWLDQRTETTAVQLGPAEYQAALAALTSGVQETLAIPTVLPPDHVDEALQGIRATSLDDAVKKAAIKLRVNGLLVMQIRDFEQQDGTLPGGKQTIGRVDITMYSSRGTVRWSLSTDAKLYPKTAFHSAPTLAQFMRFVMNELAPELAVVGDA